MLRAKRESFEDVVTSLRRWVAVLGTLVLVGMLVADLERSVLIGFCVGWLLSLFSLDHMAFAARRVATLGGTPAQNKTMAVRTFLQRWLVTLVVLLLAARLGANPVAAVGALLLLQASVLLRGIVSLFQSTPEDLGADDGAPAPDPGAAS